MKDDRISNPENMSVAVGQDATPRRIRRPVLRNHQPSRDSYRDVAKTKPTTSSPNTINPTSMSKGSRQTSQSSKPA